MGVMEHFNMAKEEGNLLHLPCEDYVNDSCKLVIRLCKLLERKESEAPRQNVCEEKRNPFLEPEEALIIKSFRQTHTLLFNKYCFFAPHMLLISKAFRMQDSPLQLEDFEAASEGMEFLLKENTMESEGWLFFYNSGADSGSTQPHRHFQIVTGDRPPITDSFNQDFTRIGVFDNILYCLLPIESVTGQNLYKIYMDCRKILPLTQLPIVCCIQGDGCCWCHGDVNIIKAFHSTLLHLQDTFWPVIRMH